MARILYFNEEAHRYTDDLGNEYLSTTTLNGKYKHKFDSKTEARRCARASTGIYKNRSAAQIEAMWDKSRDMACEKGTITHNELEGGIKELSMFKEAVHNLRMKDDEDMNRLFTLDDVMQLKNLKPIDPVKFYEKVGYKYPVIQQTIEYYAEQGYVMFAELGIYDEDKLISGMIDLFVYKHPYFVIIDWKTNKDDLLFESGYFKKDEQGQTTNVWVKQKKYLKYPLDNMLECKGNEYAMQLSTYAYMCSLRGLICQGLILFHIRDSYKLNKYGHPYRNKENNYIVDETKDKRVEYHVVPFYIDQVKLVFDHHAKTTLKNGVQLKIQL